MRFNPDPNKQAQEIMFSRGKNPSLHPVVHFNNKPVNSTKIHKNLGMVLDSRLSYKDQIKSVLSEVNKTTGLLRKLQPILRRHSMISISSLKFT